MNKNTFELGYIVILLYEAFFFVICKRENI